MVNILILLILNLNGSILRMGYFFICISWGKRRSVFVVDFLVLIIGYLVWFVLLF